MTLRSVAVFRPSLKMDSLESQSVLKSSLYSDVTGFETKLNFNSCYV